VATGPVGPSAGRRRLWSLVRRSPCLAGLPGCLSLTRCCWRRKPRTPARWLRGRGGFALRGIAMVCTPNACRSRSTAGSPYPRSAVTGRGTRGARWWMRWTARELRGVGHGAAFDAVVEDDAIVVAGDLGLVPGPGRLIDAPFADRAGVGVVQADQPGRTAGGLPSQPSGGTSTVTISPRPGTAWHARRTGPSSTSAACAAATAF
jgi:hypothetical protein